MKKNNAIIIHGGGLVDPSKNILMRLAENVSKVYDTVFIGSYSFESLYTPEFINEYNDELVEKVKDKRGTYFGTCRAIDLCKEALFKKAIKCLSEKNIVTIIVAGGDGSSRQVAETYQDFAAVGINIIFPIPLTVDGINGGLSVGVKEAVSESIRQIENIAATSLQTREAEKFGVVMVELQGRNRDTIIAEVMKNFHSSRKIADWGIDELEVKVIPANFETNEDELVDEINESYKRTLVLISEGARIKMTELTKRIERRVRLLTIGHQSQSNNMTTEVNLRFYNKWVDECCKIIAQDPYGSFCISNKNSIIKKRAIDYYAKLNPRHGQKEELPIQLKDIILGYM